MQKIQKGFTLIELMIVVAIIGILASIIVPAISGKNTDSTANEPATVYAPEPQATQDSGAESGFSE